ncbi:MAG TPA: redoxin domain-containing protein [Candidatus Nitrosotalea sp.]|nr:redoxin domain-containing protein [Candidatus Nitrosotalea sp.]
MRKEIRNAAIAGVIVVVAIAGIAAYFMSLDKPGASDTSVLTQSVSTNASSQDESKYPVAPDLVGIAGYVNTSPTELKDAMKNKVVLYDFWTYSCINCLRTLPYLEDWNAKYADKGLLIVGIHSPEFEFEKNIDNVRMAVQKYNVTYPVVLDSDHATWDAFGNRYWPAEYITDYAGHIRHVHFGEGDYDQTEKTIQTLLDQRSKALGLGIDANTSLVDLQPHQFSDQQTPELYFGYDFAAGRNYLGNQEGFHPNLTVSYSLPTSMQQDHFYLGGDWMNLSDSMKLSSETGKIVLPYFAKDVHIVATGPGVDVQVLLDGQPISQNDSGLDTQNGTAHISDNRLYNLVSSTEAGQHTLTLIAKQGFQIFTFTFG